MARSAHDPFPSTLGQRPAAYAAQQVARHHLQQAIEVRRKRLSDKRLSNKRSKSQRGNREKALHDFRVAVRRFRCHASAHRADLPLTKAHRRELKAIFQDTGAGRDADVARTWFETLIEQAQVTVTGELPLGTVKDAPLRRVLQRFDRWATDVRGRLRALKLPPLEQGQNFDAACGRAIELDLLRTLLPQLEGSAPDIVVHDARLALKRLRYVLEPLRAGPYEAAPILQDCRLMQGWLGDARDLRALGHGLMRHKAKGSRRAALDAVARLAADEAEARVLACLEHAAQHREGNNEGPFDAWLARVESLQARLLGRADQEIERKYLLKGVPPEAARAPATIIDQGYLPGREIRE
ncbi:MAG: CHAD domain-containing protein, partial [Myxococcota bacterium]